MILSFITLYLFFWSFSRRKKVRGALEFSLFLLSVTVYTMGYGLEILHDEISGILKAIKLEYIGIPYMAYFAFIFTYRYIKDRTFHWIIHLSLLVIPVITTILVFFIEEHNLFYINPRVIDGDFFPVLTFERGVFYNIRYTHQQLIALYSISFTLYHIPKVSKGFRMKLMALILAQLIPGLIALLYVYDMVPGNLDINPFSSFIVSIIFGVAILKLGLFEIVSLGREVTLDVIDEAFLIIDKNRYIKDINSSAQQMSFLTVKKGLRIDNNNSFNALLLEKLEHKESLFTYKDDLSGKIYRVSIYPINILQRFVGNTVIISELTEIYAHMERLTHLAEFDELTKVANRRVILKDAEREIHRAYRKELELSIIIADIDHFKQLNDSFGHLYGDKALIGITSILKKHIRSIDFIGRYGGEEFIIVCPDCNGEQVLLTAERLREAVERLSEGITCSFGSYTINGKHSQEEDLRSIIDKADKALYMAKDQGRNCVIAYS